MERKKYLIAAIIMVLSFAHAQAGYRSAIYNAYINNRMSSWKEIIDEMNAVENKSDEFILELTNYRYGYIAWCLGNGMKDAAEKYLDMAEKDLLMLEKKSGFSSVIYSYKSAFSGYRIGLNSLKALIYGRRSMEYAKNAMSLDDRNPLGYIQYGNSFYFRPVAFGGSKTTAIIYFKIAESLMESDNEGIKENWNYLNLLVIIAKAYEETGNYNAAKSYYEKILKIEPSFTWVRDNLFPELIKKTSNG